MKLMRTIRQSQGVGQGRTANRHLSALRTYIYTPLTKPAIFRAAAKYAFPRTSSTCTHLCSACAPPVHTRPIQPAMYSAHTPTGTQHLLLSFVSAASYIPHQRSSPSHLARVCQEGFILASRPSGPRIPSICILTHLLTSSSACTQRLCTERGLAR